MKIAIVGCGFAGLSSALLLSDDVNKIDLYDKFEDMKSVGAGIMIQPSSMVVFEALGLYTQLLEKGEKIFSLQGINHNHKNIFSTYYKDYDINSFGIGIKRSVIFEALVKKCRERQNISFYLGHEIKEINELKRDYDLVIIANGSHSALRDQLNIKQKYKVYPYGCIWTTIEDQNTTQNQLTQYVKYSKEMFGIMPSGYEENKRILSIFWSLPLSQENYSLEKVLQEMKKYKVGEELLEKIAIANFSFAKYADVYLEKYHENNVVIIGDAAHGMSPQLGQGANMAFLDAFYLSQLVKNCSNKEQLEKTLENYTKLRKPHLKFYSQASRFLTPLYQSNNQLYGLSRDILFTLAQKNNFAMKLSASILCGKRLHWISQKEIDYLKNN